MTYVWNAIVRRYGDTVFKLADFYTGESEFYDLANDPYEKQNIVDHPDYAEIIAELKQELDEFKSLTILDRRLPAGAVDEPFDFQFRWWGSKQTPHFELAPGITLPDGFTLTSEGRLTGTPKVTGFYTLKINLFDVEEIDLRDSSKWYSEVYYLYIGQ
jgi:hypothetical protein